MYISREITGNSNHASLVVGVRDGKLLVLDSGDFTDPIEPVTYALRIEDLFIQGEAYGGTTDDDDKNVEGTNDDIYSIINFGTGA